MASYHRVLKDDVFIRNIMRDANVTATELDLEIVNEGEIKAARDKGREPVLERHFKFGSIRGGLDYTVTSLGHEIGVKTRYSKTELRKYEIKIRKGRDFTMKKRIRRGVTQHDLFDLMHDAIRLGIITHAELIGHIVGKTIGGTTVEDMGSNLAADIDARAPRICSAILRGTSRDFHAQGTHNVRSHQQFSASLHLLAMTAFADKLSPAFHQQVLGDPAINCPPSLIMSSTAVPDASSGGDKDDNTELLVAVVALVISVLAFVIAILQALQQYLGTATGFSSCSEAVIGKWAQFARRQMLWSEFRFEVQFETPVIFVAKPGNTRGPLGDDALAKEERQKIIRLNGGHDNFKYTDTVQEYDDKYRQSTQQVVHTADNEKATWLSLLMAVVRMEKESREWQGKKTSEWRKATGPRPPLDTAVAPEQPAAHHSLLVCMQRKRRTWDSMPKDFAKPYATTTISHMVEIAAMLGIHWRQFDLNNDQYRAQGNGFVLYGSYTDGLGICFNIQKQGPTWFEKNRIVPSYIVKQLCFGMAPTILYRDRKVYADEAKGAETLQLGSLSEIAKTLVVLGCDINTVNYFRKNTDQARHSHLFAIPFEILGMVGEMIHVKDTVFRMLPNPTVFYWDPSTFSLPNLLSEYITSLRLFREKSLGSSEEVKRILEWAETDQKFPLLRAEGSTLDVFGEDINGATLVNGLNHLRAGIELCDEYFAKMKKPSLSLVKKVTRTHIQEVMSILHEKNEKDEKTSNEATNNATSSEPITIHDIDSAPVDERESMLMQMYFDRVRPNVARIIGQQTLLSKHMRERRDSVPSDNGSNIASPRSVKMYTTSDEVNEIWCVLVFRMLCWLQLHDFHKMDIHITKSDAYASRIPVYIV
ncbi:putative modin [Fusarium flagelliforme]|uniref:Putative modin n=1 Tax=Fusarium flagelliforme TaxID=2675880 RepID=A0A395MUD1_9HYPO|nr:putative modin [Fusarium flagelliforme]